MPSGASTAGERAVLGDGTALVVRRIEPSDKRLLADGFARLSPRSRYRRFFTPLTRLSDSDLAYLTEVDHHDHEGLVAIDPGSGDLVGVARYVRGYEPHLAEVSVVVVDDWQRRGVATILLDGLVGRARAAGITHFVALVLDENTEALELLEHRVPGNLTRRRTASGPLELLIELPDRGEIRGSTLARVLRAVAQTPVVVNPYRVMREAIRRVRRP